MTEGQKGDKLTDTGFSVDDTPTLSDSERRRLMQPQQRLRTAEFIEQYAESAIPLSEGGQKVVYAVNDKRYGPCVLKISKGTHGGNVERIRREVETLTKIRSRHFPRIHEFRKIGETDFAIIEERIQGRTLSEEMIKFYDINKATRLVHQIVEGLRVIWEMKVVHRDIKPDNIMVNAQGRSWIIDLGIARLLEEESITYTMAPFGPCTPQYASPEQLSNRKNEINHRSDQYSLGITFCQLILRGDHPFAPTLVGEGESIADNIANDRWVKDRMRTFVRPETASVLEKMLGHQPYQRYRRPEDLQEALSKLLKES